MLGDAGRLPRRARPYGACGLETGDDHARIGMCGLLLVALWNATFAAYAAQSDACKQCRNQQRACAANYSGKTCKSEYDICMKACRSKP